MNLGGVREAVPPRPNVEPPLIYTVVHNYGIPSFHRHNSVRIMSVCYPYLAIITALTVIFTSLQYGFHHGKVKIIFLEKK